VSGLNFNPQNTSSIPAVNPPKFGGGLEFAPSLKLSKNGWALFVIFQKSQELIKAVNRLFTIYSLLFAG
jgi:hypothetical protein